MSSPNLPPEEHETLRVGIRLSDVETGMPTVPDQAAAPGRAPLGRLGATIWLIVLAATYCAVVIPNWNRGYIDFGDGNYMYIGKRLAEGQVLYRDILAPQPPVHLYVAMLLWRIGRAIGEPLYAFRAFSLLLHLATMVVVYFAALRAAGGGRFRERRNWRAAGVVAAAAYLVLPVGFWWTLGYQSEPTEMLLMVGSFALVLHWRAWSMACAGVLAALATLTNMTAAPYVVFTIVYLAVRRPRLLAWYVVPLLAIIGAVVTGMELWTGAYIENVVRNQVGSFHHERPFGYAFEKIANEGIDVLYLDGGFIVLGLLGLIVFARNGPADVREYATWFTFFALCSIVYVSKGGTMDYIFTIGEPFLAMFVGYFAVQLYRSHLHGYFTGISWRQLAPASGVAAALLLALAIGGTGVRHSITTLQQKTYELDEYRTAQVVELIRANSKDYDLILAPPFYAVLADRRLTEDFSELFLWSLKYHAERRAGSPGRAVKTVERIAAQLNSKTIAFVAFDMNLMSSIPEIRTAVEANYTPLRTTEFKTLNTRLQFYVPKK